MIGKTLRMFDKALSYSVKNQRCIFLTPTDERAAFLFTEFKTYLDQLEIKYTSFTENNGAFIEDRAFLFLNGCDVIPKGESHIEIDRG